MFNRPEVQERISFLKEQRMNELGLDAYYVLKNLKSIVERCMQGEQVIDREGAPVFIQRPDAEYAALYKFDSQSTIKANELIGKHIGMFVERKEITGKGGAPIPQEVKTQPKYTPEELAGLTAQELSRLCINGKL